MTDPSQRSAYDISHIVPDPYPYGYASTFLNTAWLQAALGVPVNFTVDAYAPAVAIGYETGDGARNSISNLNYLLHNNLNVAMIHGDRDCRCNWMGGEHVNLSAEWKGQWKVREAGYASIVTNSSYDGGVARQAGKFSFSRVLQAGHYRMFLVPFSLQMYLQLILYSAFLPVRNRLQTFQTACS